MLQILLKMEVTRVLWLVGEVLPLERVYVLVLVEELRVPVQV